jgi:hypothetical protein
MFSMIVIDMIIVIEDIITTDLYNYLIFGINDKYNMDVWTNSHVFMVNCIWSYLKSFGIMIKQQKYDKMYNRQNLQKH